VPLGYEIALAVSKGLVPWFHFPWVSYHQAIFRSLVSPTANTKLHLARSSHQNKNGQKKKKESRDGTETINNWGT
jgi:hypothetical protein